MAWKRKAGRLRRELASCVALSAARMDLESAISQAKVQFLGGAKSLSR